MKLSTKGRYGVKAVFELALNYGSEHVPLKAIADKQNISEHYLEQLFAQLRKAGIVKSIRGAYGGYALSRPPAQITAYDIIRVLEGTIEVSDCVEGTSCTNSDCCSTRLLWVRIQDSIDSVLKSTTLQDMVDDSKMMKKIKESVNNE